MIRFLLFVIATLAAASSEPQITVAWRQLPDGRDDAQTVVICTSDAGRLYADSGVWIGDVVAGCRLFPPPDMLVDTAIAPMAGRVYLLQTERGVARSAPLPRPRIHRVILPVIAR